MSLITLAIKKEKMRGEGNGEKDFIIYCTVRDVEKGFCLAEVSMTNSGRVCRVNSKTFAVLSLHGDTMETATQSSSTNG